MRALVVAKAPVPGQVKTRLGAAIGMYDAARVAAASLLDTLAACAAAFDECHLALAGDLDGACDETTLRHQLGGWVVHPQRGTTFGERLARAHADAAGPGTTVQIGMDTPQVTASDLRLVAESAGEGRSVLGPAPDGGWWVLALHDHTAAAALADVPMSRADTFDRTREALIDAGQSVHVGPTLRDVDTIEDADAVARELTTGLFRDAWLAVPR